LEPPVWYFLPVSEGPRQGFEDEQVHARCGLCRGCCCRVCGGYAPAGARRVGGEPSPSLQSFGAAKAVSAYELSAPGMTNGGLENSFTFTGNSVFASSALLSSNLALDSGRGLDIGARFLNYGGSPFLSAASSPYLSLANGGRYNRFDFHAGGQSALARRRFGVQRKAGSVQFRFCFAERPAGADL